MNVDADHSDSSDVEMNAAIAASLANKRYNFVFAAIEAACSDYCFSARLLLTYHRLVY